MPAPPHRYAHGRWGSAWNTTTCGRNLSAMTTLPSRQGWAGGSLSRLEPRACMLSSAVMLVVAGVGVVGHQGGPFRVKAPVLLAFCPSQLFLHRDTDQDLDGLDPDGTTRTRPDQEPLAGVHTGECRRQWLGTGRGRALCLPWVSPCNEQWTSRWSRAGLECR
jgi:hypothetical protein